jgi:hypothetical protein
MKSELAKHHPQLPKVLDGTIKIGELEQIAGAKLDVDKIGNMALKPDLAKLAGFKMAIHPSGIPTSAFTTTGISDAGDDDDEEG